MRQVFENRMVAHVWAQRNQEFGRSLNGQFFFEGDTIYSYGRHFPIATWLAHDTVLYCDESYSVTTSNHQSLVRQALSGSVRVLTCPDSRIMDYHANLSPEHSGDIRTGAQMLIEGMYKEAVQPLIKSAAKRRKASLVSSDLGQGVALIDNCSALLNHYGLELSKELKELYGALCNDSEKLMSTKREEIEAERERARKARKEREEREAQDLEAAIEAFRAGVLYNHHIILRADVMLRIKGNDIETSHGASFPVEDAKAAFKLIRKLKEENRSMSEFMGLRDSTRLGHFKIDRIDAHGNVKAGCHFVKWPEIERAARALNIYP